MPAGESMQTLRINGMRYDVDADAQMPLLWVLREILGLTGTKYGCGKALCGACTVHVEGQPTRSCVTPISAVEGKDIVTIEGIGANALGRRIQAAWIIEDVPQCGYCQSGQILSAVALLSSKPNPSDEDINLAMSGNLCRCGTYARIRAAIHRASTLVNP